MWIATHVLVLSEEGQVEDDSHCDMVRACSGLANMPTYEERYRRPLRDMVRIEALNSWFGF